MVPRIRVELDAPEAIASALLDEQERLKYLGAALVDRCGIRSVEVVEPVRDPRWSDVIEVLQQVGQSYVGDDLAPHAQRILDILDTPPVEPVRWTELTLRRDGAADTDGFQYPQPGNGELVVYSIPGWRVVSCVVREDPA